MIELLKTLLRKLLGLPEKEEISDVEMEEADVFCSCEVPATKELSDFSVEKEICYIHSDEEIA